MTAELMKLSNRIRTETAELGEISGLALRRWEKSLRDDDYLGSVAFDLHSFYQGIERVFTIVAGNIDGAVPTGDRWHKDLLEQMAKEVPGTRPAVISVETKESLEGFRRFRHLARNIYAFELDLVKIQSLVERLPETCERICSELLAFAEFLSQTSKSKQEK